MKKSYILMKYIEIMPLMMDNMLVDKMGAHSK